jgi:integrase
MRPDEIEGLKTGDLGKDRISITRRIYRGSEGKPKNRRSEREVPISPGTATLIAEYTKLLVDDSPGAGLFPSENPKWPIRYSIVFRRILRPALKRIGLDKSISKP